MHDVRFVDVKRKVDPDDIIDAFLEEETKDMKTEEKRTWIQNHDDFRRGTGKFKLGRIANRNHNVRNSVTKYKIDSPWIMNRDHWIEMRLRFGDDRGVMIVIEKARVWCKSIKEIEHVEGSFNAIKDMHWPKRGSLGPNKLRRLLYMYDDNKYLKAFK